MSLENESLSPHFPSSLSPVSNESSQGENTIFKHKIKQFRRYHITENKLDYTMEDNDDVFHVAFSPIIYFYILNLLHMHGIYH